MSPPFRVAAAILAAGASTRMGRPKLLLPWNDTTIIGHLIGAWHTLGAAQTAVVTSGADSVIKAELKRLGISDTRIVNPKPELGMFESIRCAARWNGWKPEVTHVALVLGDQPHVRLNTLQALLRFAPSHAARICQPSRNGRGRHPVIFPRETFAALKDSTAHHLKDFIMRQPEPPARIELDDTGLDLDLDTPEDYERALATSKDASNDP
jgi:molybdenum cofactor cytidylyltransferase